MQTSFWFLPILTLSCALLVSCSERLPEEEFVILPGGGYPKLGYVPDHPVLPASSKLKSLEKDMREDSKVSEELHKQTIDHLATSSIESEGPLLP